MKMIMKQAQLVRFRDLFKPGKVVILFSHWNENQVEFIDGMAGIKRVVDSTPQPLHGILDLCVCHPCQLVEALRGPLGNDSVIRYSISRATPSLWIRFYEVLFRLLDCEDLSYGKAWVRTAQLFFSPDRSSREPQT